MRTTTRLTSWAFVLSVAAACGTRATPVVVDTAASDTTARQAHEAYVAAINSNNLDSLMAMLTEDVVYQAPHEP